MGQEFAAKTFKSGNSVALRLPKALGIRAGETTLVARDENGDLVVKLIERPKRKFNVDKVWGIGKHLDLKYIEPEDRVFEHRPLLWEDSEWLAKLRDPKS